MAIVRHMCIILKGNRSYNELSRYAATIYDDRDKIIDNLFSFFNDNDNG